MRQKSLFKEGRGGWKTSIVLLPPRIKNKADFIRTKEVFDDASQRHSNIWIAKRFKCSSAKVSRIVNCPSYERYQLNNFYGSARCIIKKLKLLKWFNFFKLKGIYYGK